MQEQIAAVTKFHEVYRIPYAVQPTTDVDPQLIALRHRLMAEENEEYLEAALAGNLVEVADALGDMLYILCGTMITHGMQEKIEDTYVNVNKDSKNCSFENNWLKQ